MPVGPHVFWILAIVFDLDTDLRLAAQIKADGCLGGLHL
jgi:hypothetical protein